MIYAYGITQRGTYHAKTGAVCQDAHCIRKCGESLAAAAVADGLGSEAHSDLAARLAADTAAACCAENLSPQTPEDQILPVLQDAFSLAQKAIEKAAEAAGHPLDEYGTTLSLALLRDGALYYGQSGDSGILALTTDGRYHAVTRQQRDEDGRVYPLSFGHSRWVFGKFPEPAASVFLATDGILETLFPVYLREEPVKIYTALARYFMDPAFLQIAELGEDAVQQGIAAFLDSIPDHQVYDDKTAVALMDPDIPVHPQEAAYYAEPDWDALRKKYEEAWRRAAYPQLFGAAASGEGGTGP